MSTVFVAAALLAVAAVAHSQSDPLSGGVADFGLQ